MDHEAGASSYVAFRWLFSQAPHKRKDGCENSRSFACVRKRNIGPLPP